MNVGIEPTKNEVSTQMTITIVYVSKKIIKRITERE